MRSHVDQAANLTAALAIHNIFIVSEKRVDGKRREYK
jgi:hypothetical protein